VIMTITRMAPRVGRGARLLLTGLLGFTGCPEPSDLPDAADAAVPSPERELGVTISTVGRFEDCTPDGTSFSDARCASGLHCGIVLVGETGSVGAITQCVPDDPTPLKENQECTVSQVATPTLDPPRRFDRCANGLGCVEGADGKNRCKRLCALRSHGRCAKSELCVLPTQVSGIGFCQAPDKCEPVFPQTGCGKAPDGSALSCYVLGDDKLTGTVCWSRQRFGESVGDLDSPCERSLNCQSGFGCVTTTGREAACRPYCTLPPIPDGGTPPDGGVPCATGLGTCHPVSGYERVGRCY